MGSTAKPERSQTTSTEDLPGGHFKQKLKQLVLLLVLLLSRLDRTLPGPGSLRVAPIVVEQVTRRIRSTATC